MPQLLLYSQIEYASDMYSIFSNQFFNNCVVSKTYLYFLFDQVGYFPATFFRLSANSFSSSWFFFINLYFSLNHMTNMNIHIPPIIFQYNSSIVPPNYIPKRTRTPIFGLGNQSSIPLSYEDSIVYIRIGEKSIRGYFGEKCGDRTRNRLLSIQKLDQLS